MDDGRGKIKVILDHFNASATSVDSHQRTSSVSQSGSDNSSRSYGWTRRSAAFMVNLFTLRGLPWGSSTDGHQKIELSAAEVESLRSELADLEEREAHLKAQLEHVDELLRSARLAGYLYIRTRWTALPGEPPPLDDSDIDDWLPRFVVLHGLCFSVGKLCSCPLFINCYYSIGKPLSYSFMDDGRGKIKVILDHFNASATSVDSHQRTSSVSQSDLIIRQGNSFCWEEKWSHGWTRRSAAFMVNLFTLRGLPWGSSTDGHQKIELSAAEVESLRSELADLEEREAHLKAQLEHVDELLRSARLAGYLYIRTRWTALPGEPPPLDDSDIDDWLPRFVVLHGLYLSPQDSTLLSDIVEVGPLPTLKREDEETRYAFYILTRQGLRYECSSISKIQVLRAV
ncbi:hypothetical protein CJ030_MR4G002304 [Morella rubra]|uniref:Uncharacterized protein n=1 Tax=Morella rubra TaxID=262757 RepID=A0A6A1VRP7_9ROSI|nr:hypothetical protein CJ030_MR4G002304 [Morella rubra]